MPNTSDYKFTKAVPTHTLHGWFPDETGLLKQTVTQVKGIQAFGYGHGIIEESDLSPGVVEFLLSKKDGEGNFLYAHMLEKKVKGDK